MVTLAEFENNSWCIQSEICYWPFLMLVYLVSFCTWRFFVAIFEMVKWPFERSSINSDAFAGRVIFLMVCQFANARVVWSWKGFEYEKDSPKGLIYRYSSQFPVLGTDPMKPSVCLVCTASDSSNWAGTMRRDRDTLFWSFGSFEGCSQLVTGAEKFLR